MQITESKTRDQFPLSYKKVIKKTIVSSIGWIFFLLIIGGMLTFITYTSGQLFPVITVSNIVFYCGLFFLIITGWNYVYQRWYFATYFYDLTPDFIQIKKGPITPREITLPYERIQDVYVDQDLLDRVFGLYDVHLSTATFSSGMQAHIDGVSKESAQGLREALLQSVKERISRKPDPASSPTNLLS